MSALFNLYIIITAARLHTHLWSYNTIAELSNIFFIVILLCLCLFFFVIFRQEGMKHRRNRKAGLYYIKLPAILV